MEFCFFKDVKKIHPLEQLCLELNIEHKRIKPRTPRHNGKVERSHRNDQERFYDHLKFYSMDDLHLQASRYLKRSNNIPMSVLNYLTPKEMRNKLYAKGLSSDIIDTYFENHEDEILEYEINCARKIIIKKQTQMEKEEIEQFLYRKGYSSENIREAFETLE